MSMLNIKLSNIPPAVPPLAFEFKLNPFPAATTPFLVPVINNPDFDITQGEPPGVMQFIDGNLGITKAVLTPVIEPTAALMSEADKANFIASVIPEDSGLLSFERMAIQSMMESQKPTIELIQIFIDMLAIIEDAICRYMGTSIKIPIVNTWIGIPSRNPVYTEAALSYNEDAAMNKQFISDANKDALNLTMDAFTETAELFGGIPGNTKLDIDDYEDTQSAYYIGYFDENGNKVIPPAWVKTSDKWFGDKWNLSADQFEQPFQLSTDMEEGVQQLVDKHSKNLSLMDSEKEKLANEYSRQVQEEQNEEERSNITNGKEQALNHLQGVLDSAQEGIDQTVYSEWFTKTAIAKLKTLYNDPFVSTATPVTDDKGEPIEPYVKFAELEVRNDVFVEIPIVEAENQLNVVGDTITGLNTVSGANGETVVAPEIPEDTDVLYFSHVKSVSTAQNEIKETKVPTEVKNYYISHDFEIVLDFEIRQVSTGDIIGTEQETFPQTIDFENDYLLRLIRIVNTPIGVSPEVFAKTFTTNSDASTYLTESLENISDENIGTAFSTGNNIPDTYDATVEHGGNTHSAPALDPENGLYEGEIAHGVDPRYNGLAVRSRRISNRDGTHSTQYYIDQQSNRVFWLVEAIKIDEENDTAKINDINYDLSAGADNATGDDASGGGGKEWYGLIERYTVVPIIAGKLIVLIARKFIPLLIKVVQIITNPKKLADLVFLIITEKLSKFFGMFNTDFDAKAERDKASMEGDEEKGSASKFYYQAPTTNKDGGGYFYAVPPEPKNAQDGKASVEIFGFFIGIGVLDGKLKLFYTKEEFDAETGLLPDQPIINLILNIIKMPFDIIKQIIDFFLGLIKKLVNPLKLVAAVIEFISFKWILDILNPDALAALLGVPTGDQFANYEETLTSKETDKMNEEIIASIQGGQLTSEYVEVLIYNVFKNGDFLREEQVERPIDYKDAAADTFPPPGVELDDEIRAILDPNRENSNTKPSNSAEGFNNPEQSAPLYCGPRIISLNTFLPLPFISQSPNYSLCDLIQVFLKPLQLILGIMQFIQSMIESVISLPFSILGLAPHIPIPMVDFVSPIENKINQLAETISANILVFKQQ